MKFMPSLQYFRIPRYTLLPVLLLFLVLLTASMAVLWSQSRRGGPIFTQSLHTDDQYRLSLRYPENWSALRRGDQIVLWSTRAAAESGARNLTLDRLEGASGATRPRDFAVITILLVSSIQESLDSYADYVTEFSKDHPIVDDVMRSQPLEAADFATVRMPHVVKGGQLFVQLAPSRVATVAVRVDVSSSPNDLVTLKRQAVDIISTLERQE